MKKKARDGRPYIPPVTRIELSEKNVKLRMILIVAFLAIAVVAIFIGVSSAITIEPGWQEIQVNSQQASCASEFTLMYDFTGTGSASTAQFKELTKVYQDAAEKAHSLFSAEQVEEGLYNMGWLNAHPNEAVPVEPELYRALSVLVQYGDCNAFLAPAAAEYNRIFLSATDAEAKQYDPAYNPETAAFVRTVAGFAGEMIRLELLGENKVQLTVEQEYLDFAEEYGIEVLVDFGWMKNAFLADCLAQTLKEQGYTRGYLASYDGFTVNLDSRGNYYSQNIVDRQETDVYIPAMLEYHKPMSMVQLRDFPMSQEDQWHYYAYDDGTITSVYLDVTDGASRQSIDNLLCYSEALGCGELLMLASPLFIGGSFSPDAVLELAREHVFALWCEEDTVFHTQQEADVTLLPESGGADYQILFVQ